MDTLRGHIYPLLATPAVPAALRPVQEWGTVNSLRRTTICVLTIRMIIVCTMVGVN